MRLISGAWLPTVNGRSPSTSNDAFTLSLSWTMSLRSTGSDGVAAADGGVGLSQAAMLAPRRSPAHLTLCAMWVLHRLSSEGHPGGTGPGDRPHQAPVGVEAPVRPAELLEPPVVVVRIAGRE